MVRSFVLAVLVVLIASALVAGAPSSDVAVHRRQHLESRAELPSTTAASSSVAPSSAASQASATPAPSGSSANSNNTASASGNTTASASGTNSRNNSTSTNATSTSTSSTSDTPKPQATDFTAQTLVAPAPGAPGTGNVAQSPDDSYIAAAHRNAIFGLSSVVTLVGTAAYFTL